MVVLILVAVLMWLWEVGSRWVLPRGQEDQGSGRPRDTDRKWGALPPGTPYLLALFALLIAINTRKTVPFQPAERTAWPGEEPGGLCRCGDGPALCAVAPNYPSAALPINGRRPPQP